jgi:hydrogenase maturation factor HypE
MNQISISRLLVIALIAFVAAFTAVFGDGIRTSEAHDISELGAVLALYGSKAVAAGVSAAVSSVLAFLTMPFKGTQVNSLKVGK